MASIRKRGQSWQAQVRKQGHAPITKSFRKKADAELWARQTEIAIEQSELPVARRVDSSPTLSELLLRYRKTITSNKRGAEAEAYRIQTMLAHSIASTPVHRLAPSLIARYRDGRLESVSPSSVRRELVILRHCLEVARREWGVQLRENPVMQIRVPSDGKARERRVSPEELDALVNAAEAGRSEYLIPVMLFALATGMRRGEILALMWQDVDLSARTATIRQSKNGHSRTVPLSDQAINILKDTPRNNDRVFPVSANALRLAWERLKRRAGIENLRFHDLRHEAISRFFEMGLSVPEVALISGHRDPRMLFRYTHPKPEDIAKKLMAE